MSSPLKIEERKRVKLSENDGKGVRNQIQMGQRVERGTEGRKGAPQPQHLHPTIPTLVRPRE